MFLLNSIDYILQLDMLVWLFGGLGFFGLMMLVRKIVTGGK